MTNSKKAALIILDGYGIGKNDPKTNAIAAAKKPYIDSLSKKYSQNKLRTDGANVGLPEGQMGNSEVGHINIGAGRIVFQQLVLINNAFKNSEVEKNKVLLDAFEYAKKNKKDVHFIGLVSDGGVHSSIEHLKSLCTIAAKNKIKSLFVHAFT